MMRFHPYLMQNGTPDDLPVPYAARSVPVSKRHKELVCGNNFRDQRHLCMFSRASRASVREQVDAPPVRDGEPRSSIAPSLMTAGACVQISSAPARLHLWVRSWMLPLFRAVMGAVSLRARLVIERESECARPRWRVREGAVLQVKRPKSFIFSFHQNQM